MTTKIDHQVQRFLSAWGQGDWEKVREVMRHPYVQTTKERFAESLWHKRSDLMAGFQKHGLKAFQMARELKAQGLGVLERSVFLEECSYRAQLDWLASPDYAETVPAIYALILERLNDKHRDAQYVDILATHFRPERLLASCILERVGQDPLLDYLSNQQHWLSQNILKPARLSWKEMSDRALECFEKVILDVPEDIRKDYLMGIYNDIGFRASFDSLQHMQEVFFVLGDKPDTESRAIAWLVFTLALEHPESKLFSTLLSLRGNGKFPWFAPGRAEEMKNQGFPCPVKKGVAEKMHRALDFWGDEALALFAQKNLEQAWSGSPSAACSAKVRF